MKELAPEEVFLAELQQNMHHIEYVALVARDMQLFFVLSQITEDHFSHTLLDALAQISLHKASVYHLLNILEQYYKYRYQRTHSLGFTGMIASFFVQAKYALDHIQAQDAQAASKKEAVEVRQSFDFLFSLTNKYISTSPKPEVNLVVFEKIMLQLDLIEAVLQKTFPSKKMKESAVVKFSSSK